jgi:hypothetical protein
MASGFSGRTRLLFRGRFVKPIHHEHGASMIDFLGIGAQKAGTTWMFEHLCRHPEVNFPGGKELHFWDGQSGADGRDWVRRFPDDPRKQGEITPAYAILDSAIIAEIHRCAPQLRLFFSLRNPVERAWSAALMALVRAEMTIDEASDAWFLDHFRSRGSRMRSDFPACLDAWQAVFAPEQLHIILFDDIAADPRGVLTQLARHLGIAPEFFDEMAEDHVRRPIFAGPGHPLRPSLKAILHDIYDPQTVLLGRRIGRNLSAWLG